MSLGDRAGAWLSAWKWVLILACLLALSVWANLVQWRHAATAPLEGRIAGLEQAVDDAAAILDDKAATARRTTEASRAAAQQLSSAAAAYGAAMTAKPLTPDQCAPGQGRVNATNKALGSGKP